MTSIEVTPTGQQLYRIEVRDGTGASHHDLGVPDDLLTGWDVEDLVMRDVVLAAVEFLLEREGRENLGADIDLGEAANRYPELTEQVPARAREYASAQTPPTGLQSADRDTPTGDDRLLSEVKQEQETGQASRQDPHR